MTRYDESKERSQVKIFVAVLFTLILATLTGVLALRRTYRLVSLEVCEKVSQNYYLSQDEPVRNFSRLCREAAENQVFFFSKSRNVRRINARLSALQSSHLNLYDPSENESIWENVGLDTGIRAKRIDGQFVVSRVLPDSPAARLGLRSGDHLLSLDGEELVTVLDVQNRAGSLRLMRGQQELTVAITVEKLQEDLSPQLTEIKTGVALLRIPSFLPQYFEREKWHQMAEQFARFSRVIVDLRGNAGGSYTAMLRALSPFFCQTRSVGSLFHQVPGPVSQMPADLDASQQLEVLTRSSQIELRTFEFSPCDRGEVITLIDNDTSSTAEIFAHAMLSRPHSHVFGQTTAGEVLMAQWFPINLLGPDYLLAIPIAGYLTESGEPLERQGVVPQKRLYDKLPEALAGRDAWIEEALR